VSIAEYEIGRRSAQLLHSLIEDPGRKPETVLIMPELVVRASTSAPRVRKAG
jgi:DNA-binding LacI/PurR family transcriptional regulator